jgi:5'-3' exonuclease
LEALEWVFTYYSSGCNDWRWSYEYHYPPLLVDLYKYIPNTESKFILNKRPAFTENVQLSYVLPLSNFNLLPEHVSSKLLKEYSNLFSDKLEFQWAFCSYFWESHVCFKNVPLETLEKWEADFI